MNLVGKTIDGRYRIIEKIGEGGMSTVWLAEDTIKGDSVAVKVLKKDTTSNRVEDVIRFRNEATTVSKLISTNIAKIIEIGETQHMHFIVMEYLAGKSLYKLLEEGRKFEIEDTVEIIYKICDALKHVHNANIVHRDLKPGNIIINYVQQDNVRQLDVKLIDFGLAQVKEFNVKDKQDIVGTLCYVSPEQSGAIKRNVDERSDLYSLGVIFYQLLTCILPFSGSNISSIIHQHITKIPEKPSLHKNGIAPVLDKIVLKLLEKEPEKRYQSAQALVYDLDKYKDGLKDFEPGLEDKVIKLNFKTDLVGREEELEQLYKAFHDALDSKGSICLISGEAGKGKTRLVEELRAYVYENMGTFIDGKCFSGENKIPFGPFKDAVNAYIKKFKNYNSDIKNQIKNKIKEDIGELGEIVLKFNPMAQEIIGECSPLVELEPDRENKRFKMVISQFFYSLGNQEGVLVLMLDDLQWSDIGSIELLEELSNEISTHPILIVGTYRDNEVIDGHVLNTFIVNGRINKYPILQMNLKTFDSIRMKKFISGLLFDSEKNTEEISKFILQKSKGNPFFATEILKQLINENAITRADGRWDINHSKLDAVEISSTVIDILLKKISTLNEREINVLSHAAIIGRNFDIEFLFNLIELDKDEVVKIVDRAIELQLLEQDLQERGKIFFVHDRIKEAFCENLTHEMLKTLHLRIANMIEVLNEEDTDKVIFDLAYHYIEGEDKYKILKYTYPAGIKAKNNYANEEAIKYLLIVIKILEDNGETGCEKWIECMEIVGELHSSIGKNDEAIEIFSRILPLIKDKLGKANIYKQMSHTYLRKGDWKNCEEYGRLGLAVLGEKLPIKRVNVIFRIIKELAASSASFLPNFYFGFNNPIKAEKNKQIILFYHILDAMYVLSDLFKFISVVLRGYNVAKRRIGKSRELALGTAGYGIALTLVPLFNKAEKYHKEALDLRTRSNDEWGIALSYQWMGYLYEWKGDYEKGIECFSKSYNMFKRIGDIKEINMSLNGLVHCNYYLGDLKKAKTLNDQYYESASRSRDYYALTVANTYYVQIYREMGDFEKAEYHGTQSRNLAKEKNYMFQYCSSCAEAGSLFIEKGDIQKALEFLEESNNVYKTNRFLKQYVGLLHFNLPDAYLYDYLNRQDALSHKERKTYLNIIGKACKNAVKEIIKWPTHFGGVLRVNAKYYALIGKQKKAEKLFLQAMEHCSKHRRKYEFAKAVFEYGVFLKNIERFSESKKKFETAYNIFKEIGAKAYEKRVAELLGITKEYEDSPERYTKDMQYYQRMSSIIALSQDLSSILNLEDLLKKIISIAIEVTGAKNGYLMLIDDKTGRMKTVASKSSSETENTMYDFSQSIINEVLESGQAVLTINAMEDEKYYSYQSVVFNEIKSVLCIPIKYGNEIIGICYLDNPLSSAVFTEEDLDVLNVIMTQAAISIENAKLYNMAITDGLTELITHKHFKFVLEKEVERASRYKRVFSLVMFDIDNFKKLNDTYGHQAGDEVLINIAKIAKDALRSSDTVARYGGEEFIAILPETDSEGAQIFAERLRKAIEDVEVMYDNKKLKVTISLGVATFPDHADCAEKLIKAADTALYVSKRNGRNITTVFEVGDGKIGDVSQKR